MRVWASIAVLGASACCSGSSGAGPVATSTGSTATPEPPAAAPPPDCVAFCDRLLACHLELGTVPRESDRDCAGACAPEGVYGRLAPEAWACREREECSDVWACSTGDMAAALFGSLGGAEGATGLPADWPEGFPSVPGGSPMPSPPMGPVHVGILMYPARAPSELAAAYRAALEEAGWTIPEGATGHEEEAERLIAVRDGNSVSVSIYREGAQTYVQTMQLSALFAE